MFQYCKYICVYIYIPFVLVIFVVFSSISSIYLIGINTINVINKKKNVFFNRQFHFEWKNENKIQVKIYNTDFFIPPPINKYFTSIWYSNSPFKYQTILSPLTNRAGPEARRSKRTVVMMTHFFIIFITIATNNRYNIIYERGRVPVVVFMHVCVSVSLSVCLIHLFIFVL